MPTAVRMGRARELVATPSAGCGSCIPCVTRSGAPCVLGHRRQALRNPAHPELDGARLAGRTLPAAQTQRTVNEEARKPRELWREPAPIEFEPCRASWCSDLDLHPKHERGR